MTRLSLLLAIALLTACQAGPNVSAYESDPKKRTVTLDDSKVAVVKVDAHHYVAWGGAPPNDHYVQYRQRRAVEMISGCRVTSVQSKKSDDLLQATVKC